MSPSQSKSLVRRGALTALAAFLFSAGPGFGQDAADAKSVLATVKGGTGLAKVKELIAADPAGARFRIDGFSLTADGSGIKVTGVMLVPGANDDQHQAAADETRKKVREAVQKVAGAPKFEAFDFDPSVDKGSVKELRGERMPHVMLQKAANKAGLKNRAADELKLTAAKFDATGHLVLVGARGKNPDTTKWLTDAIPTVLAENAAATGPAGKKTDEKGKSLVLTDLVKPFDGGEWPSAAAVQKALAQKNSPALARLRVDRLYFVPILGPADSTNATGLTWSYSLSGIVIGIEPTDAAVIGKVCDEVFAASQWPAMKDRDLVGITNADFRVPDPGPKFQKAVAALPGLDGVRVDDATEFGADGSLVLSGVQPGLDDKAEKELTATVTQVLNTLAASSDGKPLYKELAARGVSTRKMERVKTKELLTTLRKYVITERMDDVRLTRLFFNAEGHLTLICDTPPGEEFKKGQDSVKKELTTLLASYKIPQPAKRTVPGKEEPAPEGKTGYLPEPSKVFASATQAPPGPVVEPGPNTFKKSLTAHLQTLVTDPKAPKWAAVLIEQGFFNEANQYKVRGVVDTEEQKKQLVQYLESLKADPDWSAYFIAPVAAPDLEVIPMADLVTRVQRVAPAYEQLNGIRVTGAAYRIETDPKTNANHPVLVFSARLAEPPGPTAAAKLTDLIRSDVEYFAKRLPKEKGRLVEFVEDPNWKDLVPVNDQIGHFAGGFAAYHLVHAEDAPFFERCYHRAMARRWLDAGLLHAPDLSSVWFLSAFYYLTAGDLELARRDLYRLIAIEDPISFNGRDQRKRRYDVAKDLQGVKRDELEKLWLECWKELKDGAKPMSFAANFMLTNQSFETLRAANVPAAVLTRLGPLKDKSYTRGELVKGIAKLLSPEELDQFQTAVLNSAAIVPAKN